MSLQMFETHLLIAENKYSPFLSIECALLHQKKGIKDVAKKMKMCYYGNGVSEDILQLKICNKKN